MNFPNLGNLLCNHIHFQTKKVDIIWDHNALSYKTFIPFNTWNASGSTNSNWYIVYNAIKHDREANFYQANFENVINGIVGLFILNLWIRKSDIENSTEWIYLARKRIRSYSYFFTPEAFISVTDGVRKKLILN